MAQHILHGEGRPPGQRVAPRQGHQQLVLHQHLHRQVAAAGEGRAGDAEIQPPVAQRLQQGVCGLLCHPHLQAGVDASAILDQPGQQVGGDGRNGAHGQLADGGRALAADLFPDGRQFVQQRLRPRQQALPVGRQHRAAAGAVEQRLPHLRLQLLDLLAQAGLRHVAQAGGPGEVALARHGLKIAKLVEFHI
jgi:hypothetical protein